MCLFRKRLTAEKDVTPDDSVSRADHENAQEQLRGEVNHLTQLLQGALRKQDEMALEAADAWQKVGRKTLNGVRILFFRVFLKTHPSVLVCVRQARENRAEWEALQEQVMSREKEHQTLTTRLAESQDAVCQLKQLVENHVASEREKNKRVSADLLTYICLV